MYPRVIIQRTRFTSTPRSQPSLPSLTGCRRQFSWNATLFDQPTSRPLPDHSASAKLFADSIEEETAEQLNPKPLPKLPHAVREHENWTGEESMEDAVLRMLVDKYKPLRTGSIRTADQKLRQAPPKPSPGQTIIPADVAEMELGLKPNPTDSVEINASALAEKLGAADLNPTLLGASYPASSSDPSKPISNPSAWANKPLIPAVEGHRPWHTTYKAPSHATSVTSVKYGRIPSTKSKSPSASELASDDRLRRKEIANKKRAQTVGRLAHVRESTLDYRLGIRAQGQVGGIPNPVSIKGWQGLVEDRIEVRVFALYLETNFLTLLT